jgi:hypothetical protein
LRIYVSLGFFSVIVIFMICWTLFFAGVQLTRFVLRKTALIPLSPRAIEIKQDTTRDFFSFAIELVKQYEGAEGFIWRFAPHISDLALLERDTRNAMMDSFNKKTIDPLHYANAADDMLDALGCSNEKSTWQAMCEQASNQNTLHQGGAA